MKYFFIVGCPRSGTTWLQTLLAQHPAVATTRETQLFNGYLAELEQAWQRNRAAPGHVGLPTVLTKAEFHGLCTDFAKGVMKHVAGTNPEARVIVEKTPAHVRYVPLILELLPEAHFIHLIRDPRATVASLCAAGRSWASSWASPNPVANAERWVTEVSAGRRIASLTDHVATVKYETLLEPAGWKALKGLLGEMGLDTDDDFCRKALADCSIEHLRAKQERNAARRRANGQLDATPEAAHANAAAFFRKGKADSWADELSASDVKVIEYIAGDLMRECGYTPSTAAASLRHKPPRLRRRQLLEGLEWRAKRAVRVAFEKAERHT